LNIQDKYFEIKTFLEENSSDKKILEYWQDLSSYLNKKKFFGEWGYDSKNHCFKTEPEDPAQQFLFPLEEKSELSRNQFQGFPNGYSVTENYHW
jgi:hypothetical protein